MDVVSERQFGNLSSSHQLPTMTVTQAVTKKIRIKIPTKKAEAASEKGSCEYGQRVVIVDECSQSISASGNRNSLSNKSHEYVLCSSDEEKRDIPVSSLRIKLPMPVSRKRQEPSGKSECRDAKRQKMDRNISLQCGKILKALMIHIDSWPFLHPVDPVALRIPDYFAFISHPMDLGTVKSKLQNNEYSDAEDFAADVRLIFSNAMTYNPPKHDIHLMAKRLDGVFRRSWKQLEAKWGHERNDVKLGSCKSEKTELAENLQKDSHKRLLSGSLHIRGPKVEHAKLTPSSAHLLAGKALMKDGGSRNACSVAKSKPPSSIVKIKCGTCSSLACQCNLQNEPVNASSSDLSSERSFAPDRGVSKRDSEEKKLIFCTSKSDQDSDGAISTLEEERSLSSPQPSAPTKDATSGEVWTPAIDIQLSPQKALRAAMLKSRFADTIFKAKQKTLLDHGEADPVKIKQEKERMERQQREEQAKIEAQIRAAAAASRQKAETELKMKREREREAARMELEKMERTVDIDDNQVILKDLEMLMKYARADDSFDLLGRIEGVIRKPLERLGLFIKKDYCIGEVYDDEEEEEEEEEEEAVLHIDGEEGEIL